MDLTVSHPQEFENKILWAQVTWRNQKTFFEIVILELGTSKVTIQ